MAETREHSTEEKVSAADHLESVQLEKGKDDGAPVFGIDEAHQKKVMCVTFCYANLTAGLTKFCSAPGDGLTFVFCPF
jgi:hypothetical protein